MKQDGSAPRLEPPGIVRSSVSRSGLCSRTSRIIDGMSADFGDDAELARPRAASTARMPSRTTAWSSAMITSIGRVTPGVPASIKRTR